MPYRFLPSPVTGEVRPPPPSCLGTQQNMIPLLGFALVLALGITRFLVTYQRNLNSQSSADNLSPFFGLLHSWSSGISLMYRPVVLGVVAVASISITAAFVSAPIAPDGDVTLPIEVIGPDGTVETVTVSASDVSQVDSLYLKAYSVGYPSWERYDVDKASIRINGGSWVDVTSDVATCKFPESNLGCVEGPYHTIRFETPIDAFGSNVLRSGANDIDFRFNYAFPSNSPDSHGDVSTGYRILGLELRSASDVDAIDGTSFVWDDPGSWTAPAGFEDAVAQGDQLWHERGILVDGWEGPDIRAACGDCHATDGYDLQYFAFSNESIVERSKYHGLTETQGKQIAAYIRSITLEDPETGQTYDPPGRPWHPPFQPGPTAVSSRTDPGDRSSGTTSMQAVTWSAGAGVEWALDHDSETLPFLFPGGVDAGDISIDESLDMTAIPVALQFPDWNEWLPVHHPIDIWGDTFINGTDGPREDPWYHWTDGITRGAIEWCETYGPTNSKCAEKIGNGAKVLAEHAKLFDHGAAREPGYTDLVTGFRRSQLHKWASTKIWEMFTTFHVEDNGRTFEPDADPLQWTTMSRLPFDIPPHIVGPYASPWNKGSSWDLWMDNSWYQLHTTIAHGRGLDVGVSPNDWVYQHMHLSAFPGGFGVPAALRYVASASKVQQNCSLEDGASSFIDSTVPASWFQRVGHCDFGATWFGYGGFVPSELNSYQPGLATEVYEAAFREHVRGMTSHPISEWSRETGENGWEPESFTPSLSHGWFDSRQTPSHLLRALSELESMGVAATPIGEMAVWGESMNPAGNWEQFMCTEDGGPLDCSTISQTIGLGQGWNLISSRITPSDPDMSAVFSAIEPDVTVVKNESGDVFSPGLGINDIGRWDSREGYLVYMTGSQSLSVDGVEVDPTDAFSLEPGWNLIPYYPDGPMAPADAFASIASDVVMVKNQAGQVYVPDPSDPVDDIGQLEPGQAYKVFVSSPVSFSYPSNN